MKTLSVLSGMGPRKCSLPHRPTRPGAQIGSGASPPSQAVRQPATSTKPATERRARDIPKQFAGEGECVNLTVVLHGNNVSSAMPLYEYRCTACAAHFSRA